MGGSGRDAGLPGGRGGLRTRHQHHVFVCAHAAKLTEVSLITELQHKSIYGIMYNKLECSVASIMAALVTTKVSSMQVLCIATEACKHCVLPQKHASIVCCHRSMQALCIATQACKHCVLPQKHARHVGSLVICHVSVLRHASTPAALVCEAVCCLVKMVHHQVRPLPTLLCRQHVHWLCQLQLAFAHAGCRLQEPETQVPPMYPHAQALHGSHALP